MEDHNEELREVEIFTEEAFRFPHVTLDEVDFDVLRRRELAGYIIDGNELLSPLMERLSLMRGAFTSLMGSRKNMLFDLRNLFPDTESPVAMISQRGNFSGAVRSTKVQHALVACSEGFSLRNHTDTIPYDDDFYPNLGYGMVMCLQPAASGGASVVYNRCDYFPDDEARQTTLTFRHTLQGGEILLFPDFLLHELLEIREGVRMVMLGQFR
ncbi:MAG: hypothetical protein AB7J40_04825 [Candidatus Altimarinota bacterium]